MEKKRITSPLTRKQKFAQFLISILAFYAAIELIGSVDILKPIALVFAFFLLQFVQWAIQPLFSLATKLFGIVGILFISFFGNAIIVWVTFELLPSISVDTFWGGFATAWLYALFITIVNWMLVSQSDDIFISNIVRSQNRIGKKSEVPGFLFVQLDGVSAPVLDWQLKAGNLPNIARLLKEDDYVFRTWHTQLPSTTPASQAGILFGNNEGIPAFRWYEKDSGQLIVANQFKGAKLLEERLSNGDGLLAHDGVSIGNLFSGDAAKNIMVMSKMHGERESLKNIREYTAYFYTAYGFMRSLLLSIGEMGKEIYQARRQESQNIEPRIHRHGSYVLLRAITNVLMRDLLTTMVIQNMIRGASSIYVDYLDYDEVAHHAGVARAESLASLSGLDRVVGLLERGKEYAPRPYEIILLSDHGQSQGTTFKQLHNGKTLEDFVQEFLGSELQVFSSTAPVEEESIQRALFIKESKQKAIKKSTAENQQTTADIVVTGSGNLGNIWLKQYPHRATIVEVSRDYPYFIRQLTSTKGIGFIIMKDKASSHLCISAHGQLNLDTGKIIGGRNPLEPYSTETLQALKRLAHMKNAPDIIVLSSYNPETGEVHAFEELVGNHGGVGGWQREAILLHPRKLHVNKAYLTDGEIYGAESLHKVLKEWVRKT
jgi:uncharacterized membrane protein YvlD (DUF360 family)